ncbi:MAG: helix-turn-helix domain-containing protein [Deltaproteobacteria bacterium]|jgi:transposase|nr:helix-turn-helix domain-containing protein [Deltaproteobacteria bacterium]
MRYKIELMGHDGKNGYDIADVLGLHVNTVKKWRERFLSDGIDGLKDVARSGKPRTYEHLKVRNGIMETLKQPARGVRSSPNSDKGPAWHGT